MKLRDLSNKATFDSLFKIYLLERRLVPLEGKVNNRKVSFFKNDKNDNKKLPMNIISLAMI
ncbi:hypothetical protein IEQ34_006069 [Dendrobium chrysotoxum]|uniref:Uncharacterized protein n=1 Tax=Dendrobium chrysotoxum TaxID=161865 RepID=A0AAV7HBH0_DENCH|nr:hypothetical protein IEQ34_006069 [Dendrobium chrysotoxum]